MKTIWPEGIRTVAMTAEPRTGRIFERRRRLGRCWFKVKFVVMGYLLRPSPGRPPGIAHTLLLRRFPDFFRR